MRSGIEAHGFYVGSYRSIVFDTSERWISSGPPSLRVFNLSGLSTTLAPKPACHEERTQVRQARGSHCGAGCMRSGRKA